MGKASSRKIRRPAAPAPPSRLPDFSEPPRRTALLFLVAALTGAGLSAFSAWDQYQLTNAPGYTSLCNLSDTINCEEVVTSAWGKLAGVPVSIWGLAFYALLSLVALRTRSRDQPTRDRARSDALALAIGGAAFSTYLAAISTFVLRALCPVCAGLYVVSAAILGLGIVLASPVSSAIARWGERANALRNHPLLASSGAVAVAGALVIPGYFAAPRIMTKEEVFKAEPGFYEWYTNRPIVKIPEGTGQVTGPKEAPLTIVAFSDFQCPHCQRAHALLKDLLPRFGQQIRFIFHHYPLSSECNPAIKAGGHRFACEAATAAECAAFQGRFAAFTNLLFARQDRLDSDQIRKIAGELDFDEKQFVECLDGEDATRRVREDVAAGTRAGIRSTPTFFVNGRRIDGNLSTERWFYIIGIELDAS